VTIFGSEEYVNGTRADSACIDLKHRVAKIYEHKYEIANIEDAVAQGVSYEPLFKDHEENIDRVVIFAINFTPRADGGLLCDVSSFVIKVGDLIVLSS
jgi:hypothetical protein